MAYNQQYRATHLFHNESIYKSRRKLRINPETLITSQIVIPRISSDSTDTAVALFHEKNLVNNAILLQDLNIMI